MREEIEQKIFQGIVYAAVAAVGAGVGYVWGAIINGKKRHKEGVSEASKTYSERYESILNKLNDI
jgi:hypothetical protein